MRSCFYEFRSEAQLAGDDTCNIRQSVINDLRRQPMVILDVDRCNRAVVYKPARLTPYDKAADEEFILAQLYTAERAIATTEFSSRGNEEKVILIFDFNGYLANNTPSTFVLQKISQMLQRVYPERLKALIILEPPFWMRGLFLLIYPFLSSATREKMQMLSGEVSCSTIHLRDSCLVTHSACRRVLPV